MPDDVISCLSSDDDESVPVETANGGADSQKENVENGSRDGAAAAAGTKPPPQLEEAVEGDDEDVEVVDASAAPRWNAVAASAATAAATGGGKTGSNDNDGDDDDDDEEEELEIVGTANEQKFPHSRQDCLEFRYRAATTTNTNDNAGGGNDNATFCTLCYCYVCDKPASECGEWYRGGKGTCQPVAAAGGEGNNATTTAKSTGEDGEEDGKPRADDGSNSTERNKPYKNHCDATDKGPHSQLWQNMRKAVREGRDPSQVTHAPEPTGSAVDGMQQWLANYGPPNPASYGSGGSAGFGRNDRHAHRLPATARGGARQARSRTDYDSTHGGTSAAAAGMYASASYEAARAASRGRSRSAPARRRVRSGGGGSGNSSGSSSGSKRPAPHDHRQRIRTQAMLEDLYG